MSTDISHDPNLPPGLMAPVPRRVRLSKGARQPYFILLGVLSVFVAGVIGGLSALGWHFTKPIAELQQRGLKAEGKVTSITSTRIRGGGGSYSYTAHFQFPVAAGGTATGTFGAGPGHTQVGESVPVIYLPEDPSIYVIAQEITADEFRENNKELTTAIQAGMVLGGLLLVVFSLILIPSIWGDYRQLRLARWGELVLAEVEAVTANRVTYAFELPKLGRVEEQFAFNPEFNLLYRVGGKLPILYSRRNPRRREHVGEMTSVEFLPPRH